MELNRLFRVLRDRWVVVATVALLAAVAAVGLTTLNNQNLAPLYEAVVAVRFELDEGETIDDLVDEIDSARGLAALAAGELLAQNPEWSIVSDPDSARLLFYAQGPTVTAARNGASEIVQAYLDTDPVLGGEVSAQISELEEAATQVSEQISSLQGDLTAQEQAIADQHDLVDAKIVAVVSGLVELEVADASATSEERQANQRIRENLEQTLTDLNAEKAALPPRPSDELTTLEQFRLTTLQAQLEFILQDYQRFALRQLGVTAGGGIEPVTVENLTAQPANPFVNGILGLIGGAGLAFFALVLLTRTRKPIWVAADVPLPVLADIPNRKPTTAPGPPWYDSDSGSRRKESIQALRTAMEGILPTSSAVFAITGSDVPSERMHAVAVDLAASFANAGRSVLLVDADFSSPAELTEYKVGEPSLETVLNLKTAPSDVFHNQMTELVDDITLIRPDLALMPAGGAPASAADAVAGPQFRAFLNQAMGRYDLVIVASGEAHSATAQVLIQRVRNVLVGVAPGETTIPNVNALIGDLRQQRAEVLGAVMVEKSEAAIRSIGRADEPVEAPASLGGHSPVSRLNFYPFPSENLDLADATHLRGLADGLNIEESDEQDPDRIDQEEALAREVIETIKGSNPQAVYEPVAEYVVLRVEDMLNAVAGQANVSDDIVDVVIKYGFIPLRSVRGHPSVWDRLLAEIKADVGNVDGEAFGAEIQRILARGNQPDRWTVDVWLAEEFFHRHMEHTAREPKLWHITSRMGVLQILVNSQRLTESKIDLLISEVVRRAIDEEERALSEAERSGDGTAVSEFMDRVKDLRDFELSLGALRGGVFEEARIVYPWRRNSEQPRGWSPVWSEGILPNIAPLQRLGILARPVLTDEEMFSFDSVG